jgi:hypothetical protein
MYKNVNGSQANRVLMKRHFLSLALAGSIAALSASAQAAVSQSPAPADARQQVLNLMQDWVTAENKHDAAALGRILDDKFISTSGAGRSLDKNAFIKALTAGDADPGQSQSLTDETVIVDGDTAVTVGTDTFFKAGSAGGSKLRYTITCVRRHGHWVALAEHIVSIPRP